MSNEEKTTNETTEAVVEEKPTNTKKQTWLNRIWSAIVGAAVAVGAMFGITTAEVNDAKAKTAEVKNYSAEALAAIEKGDVATAKEKLKQVASVAKEVVEKGKEVVEKAKTTTKEEVINTAKTGAKEAINTETTVKTKQETPATPTTSTNTTK